MQVLFPERWVRIVSHLRHCAGLRKVKVAPVVDRSIPIGRKISDDESVVDAVHRFNTLMVRDGIDPQVAHAAFLARSTSMQSPYRPTSKERARRGRVVARARFAGCCRKRKGRPARRPLFQLSAWFSLAPRAGFEPATNRLTAGCSTTELPGTIAFGSVAAITNASPLA